MKDITLNLIYESLISLHQKFDVMDRRVGHVENRLDTVNATLDEHSNRFDEHRDRLDSIELHITGIEEDQKEVKEMLRVQNNKLSETTFHVNKHESLLAKLKPSLA